MRSSVYVFPKDCPERAVIERVFGGGLWGINKINT